VAGKDTLKAVVLVSTLKAGRTKSGIAELVLERLDAGLYESGDQGRMLTAACTYWVGTTGEAAKELVANVGQLARLLRDNPYPPPGKDGM
jgi:hypothetical protein